MIALTILTLGDMPAENGISAVVVSALGALAALALIFLVLVVMNKIHEKNNPNEQKCEQQKDDTQTESEENECSHDQ